MGVQGSGGLFVQVQGHCVVRKVLCEDGNWSSVKPEGNPSDGFPVCKEGMSVLPPGAEPPGENEKGASAAPATR